MRKPRFLKPGAKYHVVARANRQEMIFEHDVFKEIFLATMKRAKKKYQFLFFNFCIMGNHIHFIIQPGTKANLSKIMQWILSVFAMKYNRIHGYKGHVWYDRFKSRILEGIFEYLDAYVYVLQNPVEAGLVKRANEWRYNGITFMLNGGTELLEPV